MRRLLAPLGSAYSLASTFCRVAHRRGWLRTQRLNRPVASVGNLSLGGTGKTPLVAYIAEALARRGWKPGILTRGYGRRGGPPLVAIEPEARRAPDPRVVGDEPALLARKLPQMPIVVCADRYAGGRLAEDQFGVNVHILDDGFQHWALARDADLVALDTVEEPGERRVLPVGRWREPLSALRRADFIVLTRVELGDPTALEAEIRALDVHAPVFRSSTRLRALIDIASGRTYPPEAFRGEPLYAFCGIGNPRAFFRNLRQWGFQVASERGFRDHHVYTRQDLSALCFSLERSKAAALITTEKDAMNLPAVAGVGKPLLACAIAIEVQEAEALVESLVKRLEWARTVTSDTLESRSHTPANHPCDSDK